MKKLLTVVAFSLLLFFIGAQIILAQTGKPTPEWYKRRQAATQQYLLSTSKANGVSALQANPLTVTSLNDATSREAAIRALFGRGISNVSNVRISCPGFAFGTFNGSTSVINLNQGVIMSNGFINTAPGPNNTTGASYLFNTAGDSDLENAVCAFVGNCNNRPTPTADACSWEADVVFTSDTVIVRRYVFASEEYPEYAADLYNDGIAFFLKDLETANSPYINFAKIPNSDTLIAVNFINGNNHTNLFVSNPPNEPTVQFDGFTVPLLARQIVIPGRRYRIKFVIADFNDGVFNSGLFLENGSITVGTGLATGSITPSSNICAGDAIVVPYSSSAQFNDGNQFIVQLSDENGSFAAPVVLASKLSATSSGSINVVLPAGLSGTKYRIRVNSTNPALTGSSNGSDLAIGSKPVLNPVVTNLTCGGSTNNAIIDLGLPNAGFTFTWKKNGVLTTDATATIANLSAGLYEVTVTPTAGCAVTQSFNIVQPTGLTIDLTAQSNVSCLSPNSGSITITVSGANGNVTYNWSNGFTETTATNTSTISNLSSGPLSVTVTDAGGCNGVRNFVVSDPQGLLITLASQYNVSCSGNSNASIDISVSGGQLPYRYEWRDGNDPSVIMASVQDVKLLRAGTFSVTVTDANACSATRNFVVTQPEPVTLNLGDVINIKCPGQGDGQINIDVTCGSPGYTYNWSNGTTGQNASNLPAGTYTVTVTDANGCTVTRDVTITSPASVLTINTSVTNATTPGGKGSISVSATGGQPNTTAPAYLFRLNTGTFAATSVFNNLLAGTYTVAARDAAGCEASQTVTITEPAAPCEPPKNLVANSITVSTAQLSWDKANGAIGYFVSIRRLGDQLWKEFETVGNTATTYSAISLNPGTTYEMRVRSKCANNLFSIYTNVGTFVTQSIVCNAPTSVIQTAATGSGNAAISWNAVTGASSYEVRIRRSGTSDAYNTFTTTATSYIFNNLTDGVTYETGVRAACGSNNFSPFTNGPILVVGQTICQMPSGVNITTITATSVTINWNAVPGATGGYRVRFKTASAPSFTIQSTNTNSVTLTGLTSGTGYNFQISALCANNQESDLTALLSFRTTGSTSACSMPNKNIYISSVTSNSAVLKWNPTLNAVKYEVNYRPVTTPVSNYIRRSTTDTTMTITGLNTGTVYEANVRAFCSNGQVTVPTNLSSFTTRQSRNGENAPGIEPTTYFAVYPNPNSGLFTVSFDVSENVNQGRILITDVAGKIVLDNVIAIEIGRNDIPVNLTGYSDGTYSLQFYHGSNMETAKLILRK